MSVIPNFNQVKLEDGVQMWYREAGNRSNPAILLLHGFPSSSHMFRYLITLLAPHYYVIAPDLPGFGFTEVEEGYDYKFDNLYKSVEYFINKIDLQKFAMYVFDYGAPVGYRLALNNPTKVKAIITQNGNAYKEGLDDRFWTPVKEYWNAGESNAKYVEILTDYLHDYLSIRKMYLDGTTNPNAVEPTVYLLDEALLARPGQIEKQLSLFYDYQNNVAIYDKFHEYFRMSNVPVLLTWGKNDFTFTVAGAEAYKRDVKDIVVKYYNTGHFALEEYVVKIAQDIIEFLSSRI
ncbi:epoxide hydrolase [Dipodascopsis uninucleata]